MGKPVFIVMNFFSSIQYQQIWLPLLKVNKQFYRSNRWHNTSKLLHQSLALKDDTLEEFVNEITERYTHPGRCTDHEEAVPDDPSKSVTSEENFHDCIVASSSAVLDGSGDKKDSGIGLQVNRKNNRCVTIMCYVLHVIA